MDSENLKNSGDFESLIHCADDFLAKAVCSLSDACAILEKDSSCTVFAEDLWQLVRRLLSFKATLLFKYDPDSYFGKR